MKKLAVWKKLLIVLGALVAVVAIVITSVYGTVAYLTASGVVQNSFTVGEVGIKITESKVGADGKKLTSDEQVDQNSYTLLPGAEYDKNPVIFVQPKSQASYLFIIVRNDLSPTTIQDVNGKKRPVIDANATIESNTVGKLSILDQLYENGWEYHTSVATGNVYVYCDEAGTPKMVNAGDEIKTFEKLYIKDNISNISHYAAAQINVRAFAIQNTGLADVNAAWNAIAAEYNNIIVPAGGTTNT